MLYENSATFKHNPKQIHYR